MHRMPEALVPLVLAILPAATTFAQFGSEPIVAFDSIDEDGGLIGGMGCRQCETSRRIFLDTPGGLVDAVQFRLWNPDDASHFSDSVRATIYDGGIQAPGVPLASSTIQLTLDPDQNAVVTFDLPDTLLESSELWLGLYTSSEDDLIWTFSFEGDPAIGDMTRFGRNRPDGAGPWVGSFSVPSAQQARVVLVPSPGSASMLAMTGLVALRRRRRQGHG